MFGKVMKNAKTYRMIRGIYVRGGSGKLLDPTALQTDLYIHVWLQSGKNARSIFSSISNW